MWFKSGKRSRPVILRPEPDGPVIESLIQRVTRQARNVKVEVVTVAIKLWDQVDSLHYQMGNTILDKMREVHNIGSWEGMPLDRQERSLNLLREVRTELRIALIRLDEILEANGE